MSEIPPNDPVTQTSAPITATAGGQPALMGDAADVEKNKIMAVLAYFGILVLIPILAAKDSKFARFHANQGLILLIVCVIVSVVLTPLMFGLAVAGMGCVGSLLGMVVWIGLLVLVIMGIINAATGKMVQLPVIGKFTILK